MSIAGERSGIGCQVRVSTRGKQAEAGTRATGRAADAAGQKNEANFKGLFIIALCAFLFIQTVVCGIALASEQGVSKNTISGENQWTSL